MMTRGTPTRLGAQERTTPHRLTHVQTRAVASPVLAP